jgi:hypothetical protein
VTCGYLSSKHETEIKSQHHQKKKCGGNGEKLPVSSGLKSIILPNFLEEIEENFYTVSKRAVILKKNQLITYSTRQHYCWGHGYIKSKLVTFRSTLTTIRLLKFNIQMKFNFFLVAVVG